jgi:lambda repressor-like predicted transcriptional regulator
MLKDNLRMTIETILKRGASLREIARATGVSRNTISSHIQRTTGGPSKAAVTTDVVAVHPPYPPAPAAPQKPTDSVCEPHREWIETQLRLRRNAQSI